jgi:hypothetical protein
MSNLRLSNVTTQVVTDVATLKTLDLSVDVRVSTLSYAASFLSSATPATNGSLYEITTLAAYRTKISDGAYTPDGVQDFYLDNGNLAVDLNLTLGSTFTGTLTGLTTSPTASVYYTLSGNLCTINIPALTATSNTTQLTMTGAPAVIQPVRGQNNMPAVTTDNGTDALSTVSVATNGVMTFKYGVGAYTNSGTKGVANMTFTYSLV